MTKITVEDVEVPAGVRAEVVTGTCRATHTPVRYVVLVGPLRLRCPGCEEAGDWDRHASCPVDIGSDGRLVAWSRQHGCGTWWGPEWEAVRVDDPADLTPGEVEAIAEAASTVAEQTAAHQEADRDAIRAWLARLLADLVAGGEETGAELQPGAYWSGDEAVAWAYDPWDEHNLIEITGERQ